MIDAVDPSDVTIRPPKIIRIYVAVFTTFWCGLVLAGFVAGLVDGTPAALVPLGMFAFGATLGYRLLRVSVVAHGDELVIRNYLSTRRVAKQQVEAFRLGSPSMGSFGQAAMALLRDDTVVSIDATAQPLRRLGGQRRLDAALADLRAWLSS